VDTLAGTGTIDNVTGLGGNTLTVGANGGSSTFAGVIQSTAGALSLMKVGAGNLILSGTGSWGGGTTVEAGMLTVTTIDAIPDTGLTIAAGGTFVFDPDAAQNSDSLPALSGGAAAPAAGLAAVPEPGTLVLLAAALCGAVICCRVRRRSRDLELQTKS
jgi:autotransporter-associated beta strand protein